MAWPIWAKLVGQSNAAANADCSDALTTMMSVEVPDSPEIAGEGKPRRHLAVQNRDLVSTYDCSIRTLYDIFQNSARKFKGRRCFGRRPVTDAGVAGHYEWETYGQVWERISKLACFLSNQPEFAIGDGSPKNVGIFMHNRPEWVIVEYACYAQSLVTVPLYDTLGEFSILHVANSTELAMVFATADKASMLLDMADRLSALKILVVVGNISEELLAKAENKSIKLVSFDAAERIDPAAMEQYKSRPPRPDDLSTICYTSGTCGAPKGVMLSHGALVAAGSGPLILNGEGDQRVKIGKRLFDYSCEEIHLSYLPLAHIFERLTMMMFFSIGGAVGFYQGDIKKLPNDLAALRPTSFSSVPRILNTIHDKVLSGVKSKGFLSQFIFKWAFDTKLKAYRERGAITHWFWDHVVFSAVKSRLGGNVRIIMTGSAPLSPEVRDFIQLCFSCIVIEGYGQTETSGIVTMTSPGDSSSAGFPSLNVEIKLLDVPEMDYTSRDVPNARGEICIRGPSMFCGYYKDEETTRLTIDADGWVHTGDVGMWDSMGRLLVIDRIKNIFKLCQGEYVAPEKVEATLVRHRLISQALVYGDSLKSRTVAVIVPDADELAHWARDNNLADEPIESLYRHKGPLHAAILDAVKSFNREGTKELVGFEIPFDVLLESDPFTLQNGLLTPTSKLCRSVALKKYKSRLLALYE